MSTQSHLSALPSVDGGKAQGDVVSQILSEIPDCPIKLNTKERKIWEHVTQALLEYNLIHRTDALMLVIICRTFVEWVQASEELEVFRKDNGGSYVTESANGYRSPHPLYYIAKDHKKSLLDWLPEAALTIPSFQKVKEAAGAGGQGSLFPEDPVDKFRKQKAAMGMRLVENDA